LTRSRSPKKREPQSAGDTKILPMDLRVGDRLADERGEWEVIAPPYTTAGGRMVHARVQRINEPASWEIWNWHATKPVSVGRAITEDSKQ
jgi:sirohydrochlorin ferrochelatase